MPREKSNPQKWGEDGSWREANPETDETDEMETNENQLVETPLVPLMESSLQTEKPQPTDQIPEIHLLSPFVSGQQDKTGETNQGGDIRTTPSRKSSTSKIDQVSTDLRAKQVKQELLNGSNLMNFSPIDGSETGTSGVADMSLVSEFSSINQNSINLNSGGKNPSGSTPIQNKDIQAMGPPKQPASKPTPAQLKKQSELRLVNQQKELAAKRSAKAHTDVGGDEIGIELDLDKLNISTAATETLVIDYVTNSTLERLRVSTKKKKKPTFEQLLLVEQLVSTVYMIVGDDRLHRKECLTVIGAKVSDKVTVWSNKALEAYNEISRQLPNYTFSDKKEYEVRKDGAELREIAMVMCHCLAKTEIRVQQEKDAAYNNYNASFDAALWNELCAVQELGDTEVRMLRKMKDELELAVSQWTELEALMLRGYQMLQKGKAQKLQDKVSGQAEAITEMKEKQKTIDADVDLLKRQVKDIVIVVAAIDGNKGTSQHQPKESPKMVIEDIPQTPPPPCFSTKTDYLVGSHIGDIHHLYYPHEPFEFKIIIPCKDGKRRQISHLCYSIMHAVGLAAAFWAMNNEWIRILTKGGTQISIQAISSMWCVVFGDKQEKDFWELKVQPEVLEQAFQQRINYSPGLQALIAKMKGYNIHMVSTNPVIGTGVDPSSPDAYRTTAYPGKNMMGKKLMSEADKHLHVLANPVNIRKRKDELELAQELSNTIWRPPTETEGPEREKELEEKAQTSFKIKEKWTEEELKTCIDSLGKSFAEAAQQNAKSEKDTSSSSCVVLPQDGKTPPEPQSASGWGEEQNQGDPKRIKPSHSQENSLENAVDAVSTEDMINRKFNINKWALKKIDTPQATSQFRGRGGFRGGRGRGGWQQQAQHPPINNNAQGVQPAPLAPQKPKPTVPQFDRIVEFIEERRQFQTDTVDYDNFPRGAFNDMLPTRLPSRETDEAPKARDIKKDRIKQAWDDCKILQFGETECVVNPTAWPHLARGSSKKAMNAKKITNKGSFFVAMGGDESAQFLEQFLYEQAMKCSQKGYPMVEGTSCLGRSTEGFRWQQGMHVYPKLASKKERFFILKVVGDFHDLKEMNRRRDLFSESDINKAIDTLIRAIGAMVKEIKTINDQCEVFVCIGHPVTEAALRHEDDVGEAVSTLIAQRLAMFLSGNEFDVSFEVFNVVEFFCNFIRNRQAVATQPIAIAVREYCNGTDFTLKGKALFAGELLRRMYCELYRQQLVLDGQLLQITTRISQRVGNTFKQQARRNNNNLVKRQSSSDGIPSGIIKEQGKWRVHAWGDVTNTQTQSTETKANRTNRKSAPKCPTNSEGEVISPFHGSRKPPNPMLGDPSCSLQRRPDVNTSAQHEQHQENQPVSHNSHNRNKCSEQEILDLPDIFGAPLRIEEDRGRFVLRQICDQKRTIPTRST